MGDVAKDLTAGTIGGAAQLIVGHPFDTIKVKLQSQPTPLPGQVPKYSGAIDAVKKTIAAEGPGGLYKGMGAPLATVAAFNAVLFTVRGQMEALLKSHPGDVLTINQQLVCGAAAGLSVSFLACPTELIKCRLDATDDGVLIFMIQSHYIFSSFYQFLSDLFFYFVLSCINVLAGANLCLFLFSVDIYVTEPPAFIHALDIPACLRERCVEIP